MNQIREMISEGMDIINLGIGNPDISPPVEIIEELTCSIIGPGAHGYQPYRGTLELRNAISDWYLKYFNVKADPGKQILPLLGSKEGIMHISMAFLNQGDAVLLPDPGYPAYASAAQLCDARCVYYNLNAENNWLPDIEGLKKKDLQGVKLMWINYPNMPSGRKAAKEDLLALTDFARKYNILIINDNPYSFILNNTPLSILNADNTFENVLELNSLSKSHNMAGCRIGMVIGHEQHINDILKVKSNMDSGMFLPLQMAAVKALSLGQDWYDQLNATYSIRQKIVYELLQHLGCSTDQGQSGMFLWSEIPASFADSYEFSEHCLNSYHLFVVPGLVFGSRGQRYIRTSLSMNELRLKEAVNRVKTNNHD
ncbi:MAG: aminotransferase class I/II-fold pyridoxal phosphate-dependent enzyme [Bacteroidales bacterium]